MYSSNDQFRLVNRSADLKRGELNVKSYRPSGVRHLWPPPEKNMANVIDSLKRLERIGSEHSETTKKIIEAACDLSQKIVGLYGESGEIRIATMGVSPLVRHYSLRRNKNAAGLRMIEATQTLYVSTSRNLLREVCRC